MTVRDFMMLALILVVGLVFNRCAFDGQPAYKPDSGGKRLTVHSGRSLEDTFDRMDRRMNEISDEMERRGEEMEERLERKSEELDQTMEQAGEALEKSLEGVSAEESTSLSSVAIIKPLRGDSQLHVVIPSACAETVVDWGVRDGAQWRISLAGDGEVDPPVLTVDKEKGFTAISFGERIPRTLELALPERQFRLTIKDPDFIDAEMLDGELALRLGHLGEVEAVREGESFTLSGESWTVVLKGIEPPVRVVDAVGRVLGEFDEDEETMLDTGGKGGAQ